MPCNLCMTNFFNFDDFKPDASIRMEQLRRTADTAKAENEELIRRLLEETERNKRLQAKCR